MVSVGKLLGVLDMIVKLCRSNQILEYYMISIIR